MAKSVGEKRSRIIIRHDEKRSPTYYVVEEPNGKIIFESNSADEAVQWTIDKYTYDFEITFPYQPTKIIAR